MRSTCAALLVPLLAGAASPDTAGAVSGEDRHKRQPVLYEISTRPWLYSLAQSGIPANCGQYVCLKDVPRSEWQKIADDSVDMVWLMGVWQLGKFGLEHDRQPDSINDFRNQLPDITPADVIGSPYAVENYTVNSDIGNTADLAEVRKTLKSFGMRLMLDFVPNHGAVDSVLVDADPSIFIQRPNSGNFPGKWWIQRGSKTFAYGRGPYDGPWTDTLQYNYWNPETVKVMTNILIEIASQADAIRCDMGMLLLNDVIQRTWGDLMQDSGMHRPSQEFWKVAIDSVRSHFPDTVFMAEAYNYGMTNPPEKQLLQNLGFDVVYDKTVLDNLVSNNLDKVKGYIGSQSQQFFEHTAHFVENHDEKRAAAALGGQQQAFAGAVVASTIPGLRLFYFGQFDGLTAKLDVQLRRATAQAPNVALHKQYTQLLSILSDDIFHTGTWTFVPTAKDGSSWRLSAWRWSNASGSKRYAIVVNFSDQTGWGKVHLADAQSIGGSDTIAVHELLSGSVWKRSANTMRSDGLNVGLDAWTAQILSYGEPQAEMETQVLEVQI